MAAPLVADGRVDADVAAATLQLRGGFVRCRRLGAPLGDEGAVVVVVVAARVSFVVVVELVARRVVVARLHSRRL